MGELFRQNQPETPLTWTGERMVTDQTGAIEAEHYHRYFLARELCRGKDVLDVASGEGYGSAFLAQTAHTVVLGLKSIGKCRACRQHLSLAQSPISRWRSHQVAGWGPLSGCRGLI